MVPRNFIRVVCMGDVKEDCFHDSVRVWPILKEDACLGNRLVKLWVSRYHPPDQCPPYEKAGE